MLEKWRENQYGKALGIQAERLGRDAGIGLHKALETSINVCFSLRTMEEH